MSVITDKTVTNPTGISTDWSDGVTLTAQEIIQNRGGVPVSVATGDAKPTDDVDGVLLQPGQSATLNSGSTFYHRREEQVASKLPAVLSRTAL